MCKVELRIRAANPRQKYFLHVFARRRRVDGKRVDATLELIGQQIVDEAMAGDPALPFEGIGHNIDSEMRFFTPLMSGVASMLIGFVDDLQADGSERIGQLL